MRRWGPPTFCVHAPPSCHRRHPVPQGPVFAESVLPFGVGRRAREERIPWAGPSLCWRAPGGETPRAFPGGIILPLGFTFFLLVREFLLRGGLRRLLSEHRCSLPRPPDNRAKPRPAGRPPPPPAAPHRACALTRVRPHSRKGTGWGCQALVTR